MRHRQPFTIAEGRFGSSAKNLQRGTENGDTLFQNDQSGPRHRSRETSPVRDRHRSRETSPVRDRHRSREISPVWESHHIWKICLRPRTPDTLKDYGTGTGHGVANFRHWISETRRLSRSSAKVLRDSYQQTWGTGNRSLNLRAVPAPVLETS